MLITTKLWALERGAAKKGEMAPGETLRPPWDKLTKEDSQNWK